MHSSLLHLLAASAMLLAVVPPAAAGDPSDRGRFVTRDLTVAGETHRYAAWLPPGHAARAEWPAVLFLHGSGECGTDGLQPTRVGFGPELLAHPERWPFVVIFPQKPLEAEEWWEREPLALAVLDDAIAAFHVDSARVALAGMSQGGHGTWLIGARHPARFRCLVPICAYGRARAVQTRAVNLPVWAFHGLKDDVVDPADTRHCVAALLAERRARGLDTTEVRLTLFPDANHDAWDPAFATPGLPDWLIAHTEKH
jgi:predicted peptidase